MARSRNIKPGLYKNEDLAECSIWARYIFPGLWMLADREGRLEDRPKRIKGELLPFDSQDIEPLLRELNDLGFIHRYQNVDGRFIQIAKFSTHQTPHYSEKKSVIKPPSFQEYDEQVSHLNSKSQPVIKEPDIQEGSQKPTVIKRWSQPPDSLIPDSLNLIPDSPNPDSRPGSSASALTTEAGPPVAALPRVEKQENQKPTRAGIIATTLRVAGIDTSSVRPEVIDWAEKNVPDTIIGEAVSIAKERLSGKRISSAYLAPIVEQLLNPKPKKNGNWPAWWSDNKSIQAKAEELKMWPTNCGSWDELKDKIFERLKQGA